jgi:hypothetical protein
MDTVISTKQNFFLLIQAILFTIAKTLFMGLRYRVQSPLRECPPVVWGESKNGTPMNDSYIWNIMFLASTGLFAIGFQITNQEVY